MNYQLWKAEQLLLDVEDRDCPFCLGRPEWDGHCICDSCEGTGKYAVPHYSTHRGMNEKHWQDVIRWKESELEVLHRRKIV